MSSISWESAGAEAFGRANCPFEDIRIDNDLFNGKWANASRCIVTFATYLQESSGRGVYESVYKAFMRLQQIQKRIMVFYQLKLQF